MSQHGQASQEEAPESPAAHVVKKFSGIYQVGRLQAEVLTEIENLNGQIEVLSELVDPDPDGYRTGRDGKACMLSIVGSKMRHGEAYLPIAEKLVSAGADLHKLSEKVLPGCLEWCIDRRQDENSFGLSPLAYCFAYSEPRTGDTADGVIDFAKLLVEAGVNVAQDPVAFVLACLRYDVKLVEYLLKNGADANSKLPNGMPVSLVLAGYQCHWCYIAANEAKNDNQTKWKTAKREPWIQMTRLLLEHGADPTVLAPNMSLPSAKYSLLSAAIAVGDVALSKELLDIGATVVHYDKDTFLYTRGNMPMCGYLSSLNECLVRIAQGQEVMLELFYILLDKGADLKAGGTGSNSHIWNPTLLCTTIGCASETGGNAALREAVGVMLDKGVDIKEEVYALCLAALSLDTELFEMLLKNGFDTEECRLVDASIPRLGPNRFQLPEEKMPRRRGRYVVNEVKVNLLFFLLKNVPARPATEQLILGMVECLLRNGVDINTIVEPVENIFSERMNALKLALQQEHMLAAMLLVQKGIALQVNEIDERSILGWALGKKKYIKTAKFLVARVTPKNLNAVDKEGLTPLGYAASLKMHANESLVDVGDEEMDDVATEERANEHESDAQRQRREQYEEEKRKRDEEIAAREAAEDAKVEDLIKVMLDSGASPFVLQADREWRSKKKMKKVSLLEICARRQRWKQLEIILAHKASAVGRSKAIVGPLVIALASRAHPSIVRKLLERVDTVLERFTFKHCEIDSDEDSSDDSDEDSNEEHKSRRNVKPILAVGKSDFETWYWVRTGMSVLTSAGGSRLENLKVVLERANKDKTTVNALDANRNTVLSTLLTELPTKYEDGIKLLLDAGADPSIKTGPKSVDSLMLASARTDLSRTFPSRGWPGDPQLPSQIEFFEEYRTPGALQLLRDCGARFDTKDKDGKAAFHYACKSGCVKLVEWYLEAFTEEETAKYINLRIRKSGMTPAMLISSIRGTHALVPRFVASGADLSAVAKYGHTALSLAVTTRASKETVAALLENGADPNKGTHPLIAATKQNPRVWELIHKLIDDLAIDQATAQKALNHLLSVRSNRDDPYGDFSFGGGWCGTGVEQALVQRQRRAQEEVQSVTEKLVGLGANLELAERTAKAEKSKRRFPPIVKRFVRRHFLS